jgi:hypothetical protein
MDSDTQRGGISRLRRLARAQVRLWDLFLADLQPWEQEGPLRWSRTGSRLDGCTVPSTIRAVDDQAQRPGN